MSVIPLRAEQASTAREMVAAEVRAELARVRQNSNTLPRHLGRSQRYWNERLNAKLAFSIDDLAAISSLLQVPMARFVPNVVAPTTPENDNGPASEEAEPSGLVHPLGLEPRTHWITDNVSTLPLRPIDHSIERDTVAPVIELRRGA